MDNRTDWFFRLDVLDTVRDGEEVLHWRVPKPIYSPWPCCIQNSSTKSTDSGQLLEAIATALNRGFHSYKVDVEILSWLPFEATTSWLETWSETAWVQQRHYFGLTFLLQLAMQGLLRQRLMTMPAVLVAEYSLLLLLVAYWNLHYANLTRGGQATQLLFFRTSSYWSNTRLLQRYHVQYMLATFAALSVADTSTIQLVYQLNSC